MRRYNIINNTLGWLCFAIAALTYLLTIEPTASFWDCPEFITQGYKLEVGHPPGNPIFMLTARFFVTIFGGAAQNAAVAVNSMSALFSAGTILLLFWTITHLVRKLMVRREDTTVSLRKTLVIMGAGLCGSLVYTWSDTFWFSAVEGEVYAFSSFCTALVFWLILKWENRADNPRSDKYLILIAYVIGISIAVHLLNLLCIPAIVLVFYYRKFRNTNVVGSLIALGVSVVIVALILFGLVPGFVAVAQRFDIFFVNVLGGSYNSGVIAYGIVMTALFVWTIYLIQRQRSAFLIKTGMFLCVVFSGMPFIGHSWVIPALLIIALILYLFAYCKKVPIRIFNNIVISMFVIFIGYSSYALLLIRSTANTPMNQNAPDNVFALGSYLNREQYGDTPLLYGPKLSETVAYRMAYDDTGNLVEFVDVDKNGQPTVETAIVGPRVYRADGSIVDNGYDTYTKVNKQSPDEPDRYVLENHTPKYETPDGMSTLFPRMYSDVPAHVRDYKSWSLYSPDIVVYASAPYLQKWAQNGYAERTELERFLNIEDATMVTDPVAVGNSLSNGDTPVWQPSFLDNLAYFFNYQLNHMYWRYFMWNFAGRQNDIAGNGEPHMGNWISGISWLDNARLGDQSLLPEEYTTGNAGHNVFYMLPLLMGIFGLLWQALMRHRGGDKRGIEQFWVVFFLFFMTGIAIVLYLNQTPGQPRERDYAFAGSFYAFAIWVGMGVPAIYCALQRLVERGASKGKATAVRTAKAGATTDEATKPMPAATADSNVESIGDNNRMTAWAFAALAVVIGIVVPLQMVSQTWDDHDRSGRYTTRDFGMNYLNSLDENAIIFVNGDNDTFPLWYAQEVEGVRPDVKVVNISYLSQDWYARQAASKTYDADGTPFYMPFNQMNYGYTPYYALPPGTEGADLGLKGDVTAADMLVNMYKNGKVPLNQALNSSTSSGAYYLMGGPNIDRVYVPIPNSTLMSKFGAIPALKKLPTDSVAEAPGSKPTEFRWDITPYDYMQGGSASQFANLLIYDIIARTATEGFKRPVYFASTVGDSYYMGFKDNMYLTGMAQQVTPFNLNNNDVSPVAAKAYENIVGKFRWGGVDSERRVYFDETVRRMISSTRIAILQIINDLLETPDKAAPKAAQDVSKQKGLPVPKTYGDMAQNLLNFMEAKLPTRQVPYENSLEYEVARAYLRVGVITGNRQDFVDAKNILVKFVDRVSSMMGYAMSLEPGNKTNFLRYENRNLYYVLTALSMINYADLNLAALNGKISREEIVTSAPEEMLADIKGINYQMLWLLYQPTLEELKQYNDNEIIAVKAIFDKAGINPYVAVNDFVKKSGLDIDTWIKTIY